MGELNYLLPSDICVTNHNDKPEEKKKCLVVKDAAGEVKSLRYREDGEWITIELTEDEKKMFFLL